MARSGSARLVVLGAGSILPRAGYGCAGYVLDPGGDEPLTLLDCGPGSVRALAAAGLALERVRRVVFSHYHLDHCLDLFALFFARHNPGFDAPPLDVHGPVGLARLVGEAPAGLGRWAVPDEGVALHELALDGDGVCGFEAGGLRFLGAANGHCPEALSWRVERPGAWRLAYSGDAPFAPIVAEVARDADLFLCECSFADDAGTANHLTPTQAARLATEAGARRLLLTHFYPGLDPRDAAATAAAAFDGPVDTARDGSVHLLAATP